MTDSAKADLQRTANGFDWKRAIRRIEPFGLIIVWLAMIALPTEPQRRDDPSVA